MDGILERDHCHQSILKIQKPFNTPDTISFYEVTEDKVWKETFRLDGAKATPVGDIPVGLLKPTIDIRTSIITKIINLSFKSSFLPDNLKAAEVSLIFLKNYDLTKKTIGLSVFVSHVKSLSTNHIYLNWKFHGR